MVNRDRHDIAAEILKKASPGKKKTELMSDVGLSYAQAKQYLGMLLEKGMLQYDENHRFKTTKRGLDFLEKCADCFLCDWHQQRASKPLRK
jgi:predicted transcriptional regulator